MYSFPPIIGGHLVVEYKFLLHTLCFARGVHIPLPSKEGRCEGGMVTPPPNNRQPARRALDLG